MAFGHLYLTGYRGSGKSTVAKILADQLRLEMIDLDDWIELKAGLSIGEIFRTESESGFRDRETSALIEVASLEPAVVALGGGTILRDTNRNTLAATGRCVWLDGPAEMLAERIAFDPSSATRRPNFTTKSVLDEVREVLAYRRPLYQQSADCRIELTGQSAFELAQTILIWWLNAESRSTEANRD